MDAAITHHAFHQNAGHPAAGGCGNRMVDLVQIGLCAGTEDAAILVRFGHKGDMASVVFKAFHQIREGGRLKLFRSHHADYEDGKQQRDFVYVKDITRWIMELTEKKPSSGIYNMGFGLPRTWLDLATAVFANLEKDNHIDWIDIPKNIRDQYQYSTTADMSHFQSEGLAQPQWNLEKGIQDYVQLLKDQVQYL